MKLHKINIEAGRDIFSLTDSDESEQHIQSYFNDLAEESKNTIYYEVHSVTAENLMQVFSLLEIDNCDYFPELWKIIKNNA